METKLGKKEEEACFFVDRHLAAKKNKKMFGVKKGSRTPKTVSGETSATLTQNLYFLDKN